MKKSRVQPRNTPLKDLQGHTYQHEIGDPDWAGKATRKQSRQSSAASDSEDTPHAMTYQKDKAKSGRKANVKLPRKK